MCIAAPSPQKNSPFAAQLKIAFRRFLLLLNCKHSVTVLPTAKQSILAQDEVLLLCPPLPRYPQELPQIIVITLILKITIKFTVSPSCLFRVISCKRLGGLCFPDLAS